MTNAEMMITVKAKHLSIKAQATMRSYNIPIWRTQVFGRQNCDHCPEHAPRPIAPGDTQAGGVL